MNGTLRVNADLSFSVSSGDQRQSDQLVEGTLRGEGSGLELRVSDTTAFAGRSGLHMARGVASAMAARGLRVTVVGPDGALVTLGSVRSTWLSRRLTGSRHMRVGRLGTLLVLLHPRNRPAHRPVLSPVPAPPPMLLPIAPTFRRRRRHPVTTTHDPEGGGDPRLVFAPGPAPWPGDRQRVFPLRTEVTTIGSSPEADLCLVGLAERHAEIRRDASDEFVFVQLSQSHGSRVNGELVSEQVLRTSTRLELGDWTLSYYREEFADHGRPYGGRVGGEIGHQRPQAPRQPRRKPPPP